MLDFGPISVGKAHGSRGPALELLNPLLTVPRLELLSDLVAAVVACVLSTWMSLFSERLML